MARVIKVTREMAEIDGTIVPGYYAIDPVASYRRSIDTNAYWYTHKRDAVRHIPSPKPELKIIEEDVVTSANISVVTASTMHTQDMTELNDAYNNFIRGANQAFREE